MRGRWVKDYTGPVAEIFSAIFGHFPPFRGSRLRGNDGGGGLAGSGKFIFADIFGLFRAFCRWAEFPPLPWPFRSRFPPARERRGWWAGNLFSRTFSDFFGHFVARAVEEWWWKKFPPFSAISRRFEVPACAGTTGVAEFMVFRVEMGHAGSQGATVSSLDSGLRRNDEAPPS